MPSVKILLVLSIAASLIAFTLERSIVADPEAATWSAAHALPVNDVRQPDNPDEDGDVGPGLSEALLTAAPIAPLPAPIAPLPAKHERKRHHKG